MVTWYRHVVQTVVNRMKVDSRLGDRRLNLVRQSPVAPGLIVFHILRPPMTRFGANFPVLSGSKVLVTRNC